MKAPTVSIVIPAHNHAGFLEQAIESVLGQDYPDIELIVLDDGSTDDTREVLIRYSGRFFWETQPNMGQAGTLNKGWSMSKGEYLSYLAADDFLLPGAVSTSVGWLAAAPETVLTYCDFNLVDATSRVLRRKRAPEFSYRDLVVDLVCQPGPGVFFRRDAFERAGWWDERLKRVPDYEYWLRLGLEGTFRRIPQVLAAYRVHDFSQSYAPVDASRADEIVNVVSAHFANGRLPGEIAKLKQRALSNAHIFSARLHLRSGRYLTGLKHLEQAFWLHPRNCVRLRSWWLVAGGPFNRISYKLYGGLKRRFRP